MNKFIRELRRREVIRTAGLYVGVCWILIEVASIVLPTFDVPESVMRILVVAVIVGFPVMLVLAWVYDVSARGLGREGLGRCESYNLRANLSVEPAPS